MDMSTITHTHRDTWLEPGELGAHYPGYQKTHARFDEFIDEFHAYYADCPTPQGLIDIGIPGWLWPADALKLYEMAYYADGDVLEIGSFHGLSTSIQGKALVNAGGGKRILSLELDSANMDETRRHTAPTAQVHEYIVGDAVMSCRALKNRGRTFGFAFVDHAHSYDLVKIAAEDLKTLIKPGGFALFHDYNDARNGSGDPDYGVYQAVQDAFADGTFEFCGVYGCTALYRRTGKVFAEARPSLLQRLFGRA